jgi:integrase
MHPQRIGRATGHVRTVERKRGPVFYAKYRLPDGRQVQKLLGPKWIGRGRPAAGYLTDRMAADQLAEILADARRGTLDAALHTGATFADACAEFLRYVEQTRGREPSTIADYRGVIDGYLLEHLGADTPVERITHRDVEGYRDALLAEQRLSNRTIVRHLTVLHGIFKRAARTWDLPRNPASADLVDRPTVRYSGEFNLLDPEQLQAVVRAVGDRQDAAIVLTAAWTGLRLGELLALRWDDVDFALQRIHVRRSYTGKSEKTPKSGKVRSVPLVAELIPVLDALSSRGHFATPADLVFCTVTGEHVDGWALRRRFYATLTAAGLGHLRDGERKFVFHDLRHCFGSTAARAFELSEVQAMLGHAHYSTTMRYVHHRPGAKDAARLSAAFRGEGVSAGGAGRPEAPAYRAAASP